MKTQRNDVEHITVYSIGVYNGIYVNCCICCIKVPCLVDTGSSRTLMSEAAYNRISKENRRNLAEFDTSQVSLTLADGATLLCLAGKILPIKIGGVMVKHPVLVANISEPVILGLDFLKEHDCQIDIPMKEFIISKERVPCSCHTKRPLPNKVRLVDHQEIPPTCRS